MSHASPAELLLQKFGLSDDYFHIFGIFLEYPPDEQTALNLAILVANFEWSRYQTDNGNTLEDNNLTVFDSSNFAVACVECHNHGIYNLSEHDYMYANRRGGSWNSDMDSYDIAKAQGRNVYIGDYIYSLHQVFRYLDRIHIIRKIARNNIYNILSVCKFTTLPTDPKLEILAFM